MDSFFIKKEYQLELSNGHKWAFTSTDSTVEYVKMLADTMCLDYLKSDIDLRFIFIRDSLKNGSIQLTGSNFVDNLPVNGWKPIQTNFFEFWFHEGINDVICNIHKNEPSGIEFFKFYSSYFPIYKRELATGGIPFHTAFIEYNNKGFLLPAQSNVGKSTCYSRVPAPWKGLADDEALAVWTKEDTYRLHPFPTWSNFIYDKPIKNWDVQYSVPLEAIFFLEQAKKDEAISLKCGKAASLIYYSSMQVFNRVLFHLTLEDQTLLKKQVFENACKMSNKIPSYILKVSFDGRFWEEIERVTSR